jgi:hypothetical protein
MQQHYRQLSRSKIHKNNKDMGEVLLVPSIKSGKFNISAVQGITLQAGENEDTIGSGELKRYRTAVG